MKTTHQKRELSPLRQRIANAVQSKNKQLAVFLSEHYEILSERGKKVSLLLFGLVMGGASLYFMISSGQGKTTLAEATARLPLAIHDQATEPIITLDEYQQLMSFRHALDSLHEVNPKFYERVERERKGLLDSLDLLIKLYHNQ